MKNFDELKNSISLREVFDRPSGTLYFSESTPSTDNLIVRRFDAEVDKKYISIILEIIRSCEIWVKKSIELSKLIEFEYPVEIGTDYYIYKFHDLPNTTSLYFDEEYPQDPPEMYLAIQKLVNNILDEKNSDKTDHDKIIENIMKRTVLEPRTKVYMYNYKISGLSVLRIIEPKILNEEIFSW